MPAPLPKRRPIRTVLLLLLAGGLVAGFVGLLLMLRSRGGDGDDAFPAVWDVKSDAPIGFSPEGDAFYTLDSVVLGMVGMATARRSLDIRSLADGEPIPREPDGPIAFSVPAGGGYNVNPMVRSVSLPDGRLAIPIDGTIVIGTVGYGLGDPIRLTVAEPTVRSFVTVEALEIDGDHVAAVYARRPSGQQTMVEEVGVARFDLAELDGMSATMTAAPLDLTLQRHYAVRIPAAVRGGRAYVSMLAAPESGGDGGSVVPNHVIVETRTGETIAHDRGPDPRAVATQVAATPIAPGYVAEVGMDGATVVAADGFELVVTVRPEPDPTAEPEAVAPAAISDDFRPDDPPLADAGGGEGVEPDDGTAPQRLRLRFVPEEAVYDVRIVDSSAETGWVLVACEAGGGTGSIVSQTLRLTELIALRLVPDPTDDDPSRFTIDAIAPMTIRLRRKLVALSGDVFVDAMLTPDGRHVLLTTLERYDYGSPRVRKVALDNLIEPPELVAP